MCFIFLVLQINGFFEIQLSIFCTILCTWDVSLWYRGIFPRLTPILSWIAAFQMTLPQTLNNIKLLFTTLAISLRPLHNTASLLIFQFCNPLYSPRRESRMFEQSDSLLFQLVTSWVDRLHPLTTSL